MLGDAGLRNLSKVTPPALHRVHPNRRLFERLDAAFAKPVVWIHGPPGSGKTTLAASYLSARGLAPLWYRLDQGDADPATLFLYLAAARAPGAKTLPRLTPEYVTALPLFARRFFAGLLACPITPVIVFDDYHEIAPDAAVHACFASGLEEVPRGRHVVVVSRAPPPPQLARLRLNGLVEVIEPETLRITAEEVEGVVRERGAAVEGAGIARIVRQTQGWTAGVILMLEADDEAPPDVASAACVPEVLFEYFAGEVLQRFEPRVQRLLCALALMPTMTASTAVALTGEADAGAVLEDLRRRNYFTSRDAGAQPHYRFHPLFRDFLLRGAADRHSRAWLDELRLRAAAILDADGQPDAAIGLLADAGACLPLAGLVKRRSAVLAEEQRFGTLVAWLGKLPEALVGEDAWLSYWLGTAHLRLDPAAAFRAFARAFALFAIEDDAAGQFLAWAGQADSVWTDAFGSTARYDPLIASLHELLARHPSFPSPQVALKVASAMSTALTRRGNDRAEIVRWQQVARAAVEQVPGRGRAEVLGYQFAVNDLNDARYAAARCTLEALPNPFTLDDLPFTQTAGVIAHVMLVLHRQADGDLPALAEQAIERIEKAGLHRWLSIVAGFAVGDAMRRRDLAAAAAWLQRMAAYVDRISTTRGTFYHYLSALLALQTGRGAAAVEHADLAVRNAQLFGWRLFEAYARTGRTEVLIELGDLEAAEAELARLKEVLTRSASNVLAFPAALMEADILIARGDAPAARAAMAAAMALGRDQDERRIMLSTPRAARLCTVALAWRIEPDFVRALIRSASYEPPADADETWPRRLTIRTFGGLRIERDGAPLAFARKTPKRLVALLKAIVAYGGSEVAEEKLIDAVWPDEDGDAGHRALTVALHRLRKLLGDAGAITVKGGRVGLDPARCWLDLWEFERRLARRGPDETGEIYRDRLARGLDLYRGGFLGDDEEAWWAIEPRDRLGDAVARARRELASGG